MKKIFGIIFLVLFVGITLTLSSYHARGRLVGRILDPQLEIILSRLFDMTVTIDNLFADPIQGTVRVDRILFENQPQFAEGYHLDTGIELHIDFNALFDKQVIIDKLDLKDTVYFIDRIMTPDGPRNNVTTWYRYMKSRKKKKDPTQKTKWTVDIQNMQIHRGQFIFDDRTREGNARRFYFQNLEAQLDGFKWPTDDPANLTQDVHMKGRFGERYPAPFTITGNANFATGKVSFDLHGHISDGNVLEHTSFWEGGPVEVVEGEYELMAHAVCVRKDLRSDNKLTLKHTRFVSGNSMSDKIWGMSTIAWIRFLHSQETLVLNIPVNGKISSPEFEYHRAFRTAFYDALRTKTHTGLKAISEGTVILAQQTQDMAEKAAKRIGQMTTDLIKNEEEA